MSAFYWRTSGYIRGLYPPLPDPRMTLQQCFAERAEQFGPVGPSAEQMATQQTIVDHGGCGKLAERSASTPQSLRLFDRLHYIHRRNAAMRRI